MATREEIENILPKLGRGARINLKLKDGGEVLGVLYGLFDGQVYLEEHEGEVTAGPIDLDRIDSIQVRILTEGPGGDASD
ncbi:MAG: hypothetical protein ACSLFD_10090 [Solirubrobacterales bacterium]